ncbi:MAG: sensor histidine kinase [Anaerolineales bacterium]
MTKRSRTLGQWFQSNLRAKFALGLALPLLLILSAIALVNYQRDRQLLEDQMELAAEQLGDVTLSSLRHAMLVNDSTLVGEVLSDLVDQEDILQAQVINVGGEVAIASHTPGLDAKLPTAELTCTICHQYPASSRPRTIQLGGQSGVMRVAAPIANEPACRTCHQADDAHLGVLLIDVSFIDLETRLLHNLQANLALSGGSTIAVTLAAVLLSQWLVTNRINRFRQPLASFTEGDFSARVAGVEESSDELGRLASAFNKMASDLERETRASEARTQVRQRAIVEERERIARELHDGVAQLLGYVNAKAIAARLMVQDGKAEGAIELLRQLETASKDLFTDVRAAIIGLRAASGPGLVFSENLHSFLERFEDLSGLSVDLDLPNDPLGLTLPPETELQLMRITQEALANTRKHSNSTEASVRVELENHHLTLTIEDNGDGFDLKQPAKNSRPHFGLSTMRERAESLRGTLTIESSPQAGTRVAVTVPLPRRS